MSTLHNDVRQQTRRRYMVVAASLMLLSAAGLLGGMLYLQRRAAAGDYGAPQSTSPQITTAQQDARLAKAKILRDKWQPWAMKHKDALKRMLNAQPSDKSALMAAYAVTPKWPGTENNGIAPIDLIPSRDLSSLANRGIPMFAWCVVSGMPPPNIDSPGVREKYDQQVKHGTGQMRDNFVSMRDIEVAQSMGSGRTQISFWASGRITEWSDVDKPVYREGRVVGLTGARGPDRQIVAPYDFLQ